MENTFDTVVYGTPLEPLAEDETPDKRPVQDLTVRDENGRRRFHGAFTGGFSAGYYNTVGTKEGWTPSYFKSSRYSKADKLKQRPEDFMDNEDLNQFGIAHRTVQATKDFRTTPSDDQTRKSSSWNANNLVIPGSTPLEDLIKPVNDNIGVRLLRALGWKPGQGIGPRVKKKAKPKPKKVTEPGVKVYGCALPTELSDEEYDHYALAFTFAPEDVSTIPYLSKDDMHGIGYKGIGDTDFLGAKFSSEDPNTTKAVLKSGKKIAIRGQAFGVGAFENDDADIYAKDDMNQYDFELTDPQNSVKNKRKAITNKDAKEVKKDLQGFHLATKPVPPKKKYLPPELPKSFVPNLRIIQANIIEKFSAPSSRHNREREHHHQRESTSAPKTSTKFLNRHVLSAEERAEMLGDKFQMKPPSHLAETVIPQIVPQPSTSTSTSTKDQLNEAWKSRLASLEKDKKLEWPTNLKQSSLKPFASDLAKQKRYELYIEMQKAGRTDFGDFQPKSMTEWEKEKEREEFYRAAVLFRPLTGTLSQKFVSKGTTLENDHEEIMAAREKNAKEAADKMKSEIKVKRTIQEWHPDKLVCRRFNVPNPFPDSTTVGLIGATKQKVSIFEFLPTTENTTKSAEPVVATQPTPAKILTVPPPIASTSKAQPALNVPLSSSKSSNKTKTHSTSEEETRNNDGKNPPSLITNQDSYQNEENVPPAPSLDLFKAIFANSESESEPEDDQDEDQDDDEVEEIKIPDKIVKTAIVETHIPRPPPKGVFASLGEVNKPKMQLPTAASEDEVRMKPNEDKAPQPDLYGPALPPPELLEEDSWRERSSSEHKSKKHKKDKRKKKKRKHDSEEDLNSKLKKKLKELSHRK